MRVIGLAGWSGSGKTTLLVELVTLITGLGYTVSTIKHAHHAFDVDQPGKDSHRHRAAGANEVLVASANRWALMHELAGAPEPDLDHLLTHMSPVDLVLVEGYKHHAHNKIEVHRPALGQPMIAPTDSSVIAIASDGPIAEADELGIAILDLNDAAAIAHYILATCALDAHRSAPAKTAG
ncbi:MAG: molybdopterin-guanine dinucleotide biosynthesis protein B [Alphaproteobacteria bacterium]|nr:molybdopterin-guanine dinucleotide biosynthesis protein B [Alphaproteobacteria bacterium]